MTREIQISKGKIALVDDEDYDRIACFPWIFVTDTHRVSRNGYAHRLSKRNSDGRRITIRMHRQILNAKHGQIVDHIDHNGINNCKSNLRFCDKFENSHNAVKLHRPDITSRYKGVSLDPRRGLWRARITAHGKVVWLGRFASEEEAAIAYNAAAVRLFGAFAFLNVIRSVSSAFHAEVQ